MVVVLQAGERKVGFLVEDILGEREIVTKDLGSHLKKVDYVAGATILGSGEVALILDAPQLLWRKQHEMRLAREQPAEETVRAAGGHMILVVEDQVVTRQMEKSILVASTASFPIQAGRVGVILQFDEQIGELHLGVCGALQRSQLEILDRALLVDRSLLNTQLGHCVHVQVSRIVLRCLDARVSRNQVVHQGTLRAAVLEGVKSRTHERSHEWTSVGSMLEEELCSLAIFSHTQPATHHAPHDELSLRMGELCGN